MQCLRGIVERSAAIGDHASACDYFSKIGSHSCVWSMWTNGEIDFSFHFCPGSIL